MASAAEAARAYLDELAGRPAARQPATMGEIWRSAFGAEGLHTLTGIGQAGVSLEQQAWEELAAAVTRVTGQPPHVLLGGRDIVTFAARGEALRPIVAGLPEEQRAELEPLLDIRGRAASRAQEFEREAAEVAANTFGLSGHALAWLAGITRQALDPVNLVGGIVAGPTRGALVSMLGREFAVGAGLQAVQEPFIQRGRAELGLESGFGQALFNVVTAGAGGAALSGLFRGAAYLYRRATSTGRPPPATLRDLSAEDLDLAAMQAERDAAIEAALGGIGTASGRARAGERIDRAAAAMEAGRPVSGSPPAAFTDALQPDGSFPVGYPERAVLGDADVVIRADGSRVPVRYAVVELGDLVVSHNVDGVPNPAYPAPLQNRDRTSVASRTFVAEGAASLQPELLGRSPTAGAGAPIVGPTMVAEAGNGRLMMLARSYDRHPERAAAYRAFLEAQGYDLSGFQFPVLVRVREGPVGDLVRWGREGNISATAGLSKREQALSDARLLDSDLMGLWRGTRVNGAENAAFLTAFADRIVAPEERPSFIQGGRLSADGARRVEAALVARAWQADDVVSALYEDASPTSRAILGALADAAPAAARLRTAIDEGRVAAAADIAPAILQAYRLVEQARAARQPIADALAQSDLERGAVPEAVRAAARLFFRDDELRLAAGRDIVAERLDRSIERALETQGTDDLFGFVLDATSNLTASAHVGDLLDDVPIAENIIPLAREGGLASPTIPPTQPFRTLDEVYAVAPMRQAELEDTGRAIAEELGVTFKRPPDGIKARDTAEEKIGRKGYADASEMTDVVRIGFMVDLPAQADAVVQALGARFDILDEGWREQPRSGYVDRKVLVRFEDGLIGEVQLWEGHMYRAKFGRGTPLYNELRDLSRKAPPNDPRLAALEREGRELYSAAIAAADPAWAEVGRGGSLGKLAWKSASERTAPESTTSQKSTSVQASEPLSTANARRSGVSTAGRNSQLTNSMGDASAPNIGPDAAPVKSQPVGDAELALEAERLLEELGEDIEIELGDTPETARRVSFRREIADAEEDAAAARELIACIGRNLQTDSGGAA